MVQVDAGKEPAAAETGKLHPAMAVVQQPGSKNCTQRVLNECIQRTAHGCGSQFGLRENLVVKS
jgi:hypothetical protein